MSKLLINEHPLQVLPSLAVKIGLNEAMVLQQIHYWTIQGKNEINGNSWVYNSVSEWKRQFPFWSEQTIRRAIANLKERGLLIAKCLSPDPFNRTPYYRIDHEALAAVEHSNLEPASNQSQNEIAVGSNLVSTVGSNLASTVGSNLASTVDTETIHKTISETSSAVRPQTEKSGPAQGDLLDDEQLPPPAEKAKRKVTEKAAAAEGTTSANPESDPLGYLLSRGVAEQTARDWLKARKEKGAKSMTVSAIETIESEAQTAGLSFVEAIKVAAGEQWRGFKAAWYLKDKQGAATPQRGGFMSKQDRAEAENRRNHPDMYNPDGTKKVIQFDVTPLAIAQQRQALIGCGQQNDDVGF